MELVAGVVEITGFAIDEVRIDHVEIWIDGTYIGNAIYGFTSPEVVDRYPWLPVSLTREAGYEFDLDTVAASLADGEHSLVVWTEDRFGGRNIIGERRFVLDNQSP